MPALLDGVRVLDLTNVLAGPFCCHQMAYLGADVIKVEMPGGGDLARQLGADPALNRRLMGVSFLAQNSGKRSIALNLKAEAGKEVFRRLVEGADVLVENFRPGVMDRLGLGHKALREVNPEMIYCAISGFGQEGPLSAQPAYDQIIQGMSGVMSVTGDAETAPLRVGYPAADTMGGMTAAFAISAALSRPGPGRGVFIDVSMLDAMIASMGWIVSNTLVAGRAPTPMGNDNFTASPSGAFRAADGLINIAANKQEQFEAVCRVIGRPELAEDPRFAQRQDRLDNRAALTTALEEALAARPSSHWVEALNAAGVPAGPVLTVPEALNHPQVQTRELVGAHEIEGLDAPARIARTGMRIDGESPATTAPPPELGAHTEDILREIGLGERVEALRAQGAI